jgi:hypothetical protein
LTQRLIDLHTNSFGLLTIVQKKAHYPASILHHAGVIDHKALVPQLPFLTQPDCLFALCAFPADNLIYIPWSSPTGAAS